MLFFVIGATGKLGRHVVAGCRPTETVRCAGSRPQNAPSTRSLLHATGRNRDFHRPAGGRPGHTDFHETRAAPQLTGPPTGTSPRSHQLEEQQSFAERPSGDKAGVALGRRASFRRSSSLRRPAGVAHEFSDEVGESRGLVQRDQCVGVGDLDEVCVRDKLGKPTAVLGGHHRRAPKRSIAQPASGIVIANASR